MTQRSVDGGTTWIPVTSTREVRTIALGRGSPGRTYPAIYISGFVNTTTPYGVFRSIDATSSGADALTWTRLTSAPAGSIDAVYTISASQEAYGNIYLGLRTSGYVVGVEQQDTEYVSMVCR